MMSGDEICILGVSTTSGNRGVSALGASVASLCKRSEKGGDVVFLSAQQTPQSLVAVTGGERREYPSVHYRTGPRGGLSVWLPWIVLLAICYRLIPSRRFRGWLAGHSAWIGNLERSRWVGDIRGGDSFSDIYGWRRFLFGFMAAYTAILVKGSLVQLPQTYGPFKSPLAKVLARYLLRRSPVVVARDTESQRVAQEILGEGRQVLLSPDVAFALEVAVPGMIELSPPVDEQADGEVVGINVNGLMYNGGYTRGNQFGLKLDYKEFLVELVERIAAEGGKEIWLIPHTYAEPGDVESDNDACRQVREGLADSVRHRVRVVTGEYDQHHIKGVIGRCGFFVGSRMHSCIAALSQGIPCVGVAYSMKFKGVFASVGVGDWVVDGREVGAGEAVEKVIDCYRDRGGVREPLGRAADGARSRLHEVFDEILGQAGDPVFEPDSQKGAAPAAGTP